MAGNALSITIRRARASDKKVVLGFCRRTWGDWGDYIDKVWDEWVKDKRGFFAIAAIGKRPVGTAKLTVLNKREMWFEGLRVDPSFRGAGISHLLTGFLAKEALRRGAETVRYATGAGNRASLHIGKSWGLRLVGKYSILTASSDGRRCSVFERTSDPVTALAAVANAGVHCAAGLASEGWTFFEVNRDFLAASFKKREVFLGLLPPQGADLPQRRSIARRPPDSGVASPLGILIASPQRKKGRLLVKLVAELRENALGLLLSGTRKLAHELALPRVRLIVPAKRAILACAKGAGFREEDEGFYHVVMEAHLGDKRTRARVERLVNRYV
ncbi:MAG: GNAT family N-acetyltransferase [Candidatus Eisenbacteria bacterium]|nr:GNAT family N-acetyltransferase [Candidatus Eisenbacteria bacterium]